MKNNSQGHRVSVDLVGYNRYEAKAKDEKKISSQVTEKKSLLCEWYSEKTSI